MASRNQPPEPTLGSRRLWLSGGWTLVLLVIFLSLTPAPIQLPVDQGDKFGHIFAYAVLMSWFASIYATSAQRAMFAIGFIVLGISLEFLQRWTGYRSFDVADMVADAIGVAAGWMLSPPRTPHYLRLIEKIFRVR